LTEAEVTLLIAAAGENLRTKTILAVLAYTGVRNDELTRIKIGDVNFATQTIHVTGKGARERKVCMGGSCMELLMSYINERAGGAEEFLFVTHRHGYPLEQQDVRKIVRIHAKKAGINKRVFPHLLRHSLATNLLRRGASLISIRDQLGHEFLQSTLGYIHATVNDLQADYKLHCPSYL